MCGVGVANTWFLSHFLILGVGVDFVLDISFIYGFRHKDVHFQSLFAFASPQEGHILFACAFGARDNDLR